MNIKKDAYILSKEEFEQKVSNIKQSPNTIEIFKDFDDPFYFYNDFDIQSKLLALHKLQWEFDGEINKLSEFAQKQLIISFLIDEIKSSNNIESIVSTRHDIYYVIANTNKTKNKKLESITNSYQLLLKDQLDDLVSLESIRNVYGDLLLSTLANDEIPDGKIFRKDKVFISNGIENIHVGFVGEDNIDKGMKEFLDLLHSKEDIYIRLILTHFMIEDIHPFYDGNGRLGRYLFSYELYKETKSYMTFLISTAFNSNKSKYYKAFNLARDIHQYHFLNAYVESILDLLIKQVNTSLISLKNQLREIQSVSISSEYSKSEKKMFTLLCEGTIFSTFGISNEEIITHGKVSKRSVIYFMNKLKLQKCLIDTKIGKVTYHKLDLKMKIN